MFLDGKPKDQQDSNSLFTDFNKNMNFFPPETELILKFVWPYKYTRIGKKISFSPKNQRLEKAESPQPVPKTCVTVVRSSTTKHYDDTYCFQ